MATATVPKQKGAPAEEAAPAKGKKKLLVLVLVPVLLLVAGGAAWFFFLKGPKEEPPPEPGEVVAMEPISINLADGHYLKLGLALQLTAAATHGGDGSKALDLAIETFSGKHLAELQTPEVRHELKEHLLHEVEEAYHHEVMDVYFTEFVMQ